jgi:hypothetical protein
MDVAKRAAACRAVDEHVHVRYCVTQVRDCESMATPLKRWLFCSTWQSGQVVGVGSGSTIVFAVEVRRGPGLSAARENYYSRVVLYRDWPSGSRRAA